MFFGATAIAQVPIGDDASVVNVAVTGVQATGVVNFDTVQTDQNVNVTGVSATCVHGVVAVAGGSGAVINAGASVGTTGLGSVTVVEGAGAVVNVVGLQATSAFNGAAVTVTGNSQVVLTGFSVTASLGTVTQRTSASVAVRMPVSAQGIVGVSPTITGTAVVNLTGIEATASVSSVIVWGNIIPGVDTIWTEIAA